jgi:iron-sulfur cluster repair protein YtfE (RIC family)
VEDQLMQNRRIDFAGFVRTMEHPSGIDMNWTVNDVLRLHPATVRVFNEFAIDACCGGDATIAEAAERDGADADILLAALRSVAVAA